MVGEHISRPLPEDIQQRVEIMERTILNLQAFYNGKILKFTTANEELQNEIKELSTRVCMLEAILMNNHPAVALMQLASEYKKVTGVTGVYKLK